MAEIEGKVLAEETVAEIDDQESAAELPPASSLEKRVKNLEIVRRLCLYHVFRARMFQYWGRHAERLIPAGEKSSFFDDLPEEGETP